MKTNSLVVILLVLGTSTTLATLASMSTDTYAPSGRRWTPALGDTITYDSTTGKVTSQMNPEYGLAGFTCQVVENTEKAGMAQLSCDFYGEDYTKQ